jgi:hypothetical protein
MNPLRGGGDFVTTDDGAALGYDISGTARVVSHPDSTEVEVSVDGLGTDAPEFPTHVHNGACADGGGTHYLVDPTQPAGEANEIWPTVENDGGHGEGFAMIDQAIRPDARSVVIHDPATKKKIACADITILGAHGRFADLPAGTDAGLDVEGFAGIRGLVDDNAIVTFAFVTGLAPNTSYPAHVHNDVCANGGGGHYQVDPNAAPGMANEIWLTLDTDDDGAARTHTVTADAQPRLDARAVVIHDPVSKAKLACADLQ